MGNIQNPKISGKYMSYSTVRESQDQVYSGIIDDQKLVKDSRSGGLRLWLTVAVDLMEGADTGVANRACPPFVRNIPIHLPNGDNERLRRGLEHLHRLGFIDDDLARLHPEHRRFVDLAGQRVYARINCENGQVYWNLFWPRGLHDREDFESIRKIAADLRNQIVTDEADFNAPSSVVV
jgi:hypothetical protein